MARTLSNMIELGTVAPAFSLPDTVSGKTIDYGEGSEAAVTVIMFICNHCPYVIHVNDELVRIANDYMPRGVTFYGISSNDAVNYPQDGPELMKEHAHKNKYPFPYLYDETQDVARAYDAACTPDIYVFNKSRELVYRGRIDDSRPNTDIPLTGEDLRAALDAILGGEKINELQHPSMGCNIKWKQK